MRNDSLQHLWIVEAKQNIQDKWGNKEFKTPKKESKIQNELGSSFNDILFPFKREEEFQKLKYPHIKYHS